MDVEEDEDFPLILDRPFIKTAKVIINVDEGKVRVRVQQDKVTFDILEGSKSSIIRKDCL